MESEYGVVTEVHNGNLLHLREFEIKLDSDFDEYNRHFFEKEIISYSDVRTEQFYEDIGEVILRLSGDNEKYIISNG
ncbi:MAG: hypothetical protein LBL35_03050 [Clostridiales bacterium]|nr:hypothetical protein [Clostridiales bacterium]